MSEDALYVCPECGSPSVEYSSLAGGDATCTACKWAGSNERLLAIPGELRGKEETFTAMRNDLRNTFGRAATDFGRFLIKWGFLDAKRTSSGITIDDPKQLARYMTVIAKETFIAVLNERRRIEEERVRG
jgi:hypothetical protein